MFYHGKHMSKSFEIIDHTADIGITAHGSTMKHLFESAAQGLFSIITDTNMLIDDMEYPINLQAGNRETLLIDWLNELIYIYEVEHIVFKSFYINTLSDTSLEALCMGDSLDGHKYPIKREVKAATYHMLSITGDAGGFHATIIFDI